MPGLGEIIRKLDEFRAQRRFGSRLPDMETARYRIDAALKGDPVSERGQGMGAPLPPSPREWVEASVDAATPMPMAALTLKSPVTPKATQKAYKLFRAKDGKLYPLFVDAQEEVPLGNWVRAEEGGGLLIHDKNGQPYTIGSTGNPRRVSDLPEESQKTLRDAGIENKWVKTLAWRPGWHAGDTPMSTHIGVGGKGGKPAYRPPNQVWAEVDMAADVDWQKVAAARAQRNKQGKPIARTAHITDQVPYEGYYRYKTNPNMTGEWLIGGDMRVNKVLTDEQVRELNAIAGMSDLPRQVPLDLSKLGF